MSRVLAFLAASCSWRRSRDRLSLSSGSRGDSLSSPSLSSFSSQSDSYPDSTSYTTVNGRTVNTHEQAVRSEGMVHVEDWYEDCYRELSQVIECFLILPFLFCDFLPQSLSTPPSAEPPVLGPLSSTFPTRRCTDELLQQRSAHLHTEHPAHDQDILGARVFRRLVLGGHPPSARAQPTPCEAWKQPADQLSKCDRTLHLHT